MARGFLARSPRASLQHTGRGVRVSVGSETCEFLERYFQDTSRLVCIDATREGKSSVLSSSCFTLDSRNYSRARAAITEGLSMIQRRLIFTSDSWRKPNCTNDYEPVDRTECLIKSCVSWIVKIRGGGTWRGTWNLSRCLFEGTRSLRIRSTLFLFPRDEMRRGSRIGWPWKRRNSILRARNLISRSSLFFRARTKTIKRFLLRILFHSSCVCVCVCIILEKRWLAF